MKLNRRSISVRVLYWPRDEYDCTEESRRIEHPSTEHYHCESDADVIRVMDEHAALHPIPWINGRRYRCVTGPGGLVRGVEP